MITDENLKTISDPATLLFSFRPLMHSFPDNDGSNADVAPEETSDAEIEDVINNISEDTNTFSDGPFEPVTDDEPKESAATDDTSVDYARNQLCDSYKALYDLILENLKNGNFNITEGLSSYVSDDVFNVNTCIRLDHPELFWFTGASQLTSDSATGAVLSLDFSIGCGLACEPSAIAELQAKVETAAAELISQAAAIDGDYEKALFVHDELVKRLSYSHELASERCENEPADVSLKCSIYGAFIDNSTVCQGYAQAFQYVMKQLGIECAYVSGTAKEGSHAWNLVKLDGEYYYVDVTWDDPTFDSENDACNMHRYCFVPSSWMSKTHTNGEDVPYPECTAMACNYYVRTGLYMETYSAEQAKNCIKTAVDSGVTVELAFGSTIEFNNALDSLVKGGAYSEIMAELGQDKKSFRYIGKDPVIIFSDDSDTDASVANDDETERRPELPKPAFSRALYHERYYLLYGAKEDKTVLKPKKTLDYMLGLGFGNNSLHQARKGSDIAALIEKTFDPTKPGSHFCDFCAVELAGTEYEVLSDGRERCMQCGRTAVRKAEDFIKIYEEVRRNMESFFGIKFSVSFRIQMVTTQQLANRTGMRFEPTDGFDARAIGVAIRDNAGYTLLIENGTPKVAAMLTIAHELTHIWQYLNWDDNVIVDTYGADLRLEVYEGMAKWVEIQYAHLINEVAMATREQILTLHRNDEYGRGFVRYLQQYPFSKGSYITKPTPFLYGNKPL